MANKVIRLDGLSAENIEKAAQELRDYADWVERKSEELVEKLAKRGATVAELRFTGARYDGENDVEVRVDPQGNTATIYAEGTAVAFIEFGSGAAMGYGHPEAGKHGLGPGTWSTSEELGGKGHWNDPNGWYYKHGKKSHGNPPAMAMYGAVQAMTYELTMIAREVFGTA
jgi:hypothetical protein